MSRIRNSAALIRRCAPAPILVFLLLLPSVASGEDPADPETVRQRTEPLRTALHHEPTLSSPLKRLLDLYRAVDKVEDLLAIYRAHLGQYPADLSARTVLVRLLLATNDPEAPRQVRDAAEQHPRNAYLQYLRFTVLEAARDERALDALDAAIRLEVVPARRRRWIEDLLRRALAADRRELAATHLDGLAAALGGGARANLSAARTMREFGFHERALAELEQARAASPGPEDGVEIDLLAASLEVALGRRKEAAARLDGLLDRVTADYWRRSEILRRRARIVGSNEERDAMVATARQAALARPADESAALDLARLLIGFERHREALKGLLSAAERIPTSRQIEQEILAAFDRLRDERGRADFLETRLRAFPERQDLRERCVRSLFLLGRRDEGRARLERFLEPLTMRDRVARLVEIARSLRMAGAAGSAAELYARVVALDPARLDLRREWAECHFTLGDREEARRVLSAELPPETAHDVFIDLVNLLMAQRLYPEARRLLRQRLESHSEAFEVHLLLVRVEGRLDYGEQGGRRLVDARALADTPARYRRWLSEALVFHEEYAREAEFIEEERLRLEVEGGDWSERRVARLEAFAEVGTNASAAAVVPIEALLQRLLAGPVPAPYRIRLRRVLAGALEASAQGALEDGGAVRAAATQELRLLVDEDPAHVHEYRARLALIHTRSDRLDLARPFLEQLDVAALNEARLLSDLVEAYTDLEDGPRVIAALARLATVDPSDRDAWERWIKALTATGDESRLRATLRRLLRGVPRLELALDTQNELRLRLIDSYWRSIRRFLTRADEPALLDALELLDGVERLGTPDSLPLWIAWARGFVQNALGRTAARDEAVAVLERVMAARLEESARAAAAKSQVRDSQKKGDAKAAPPPDRIYFPDGLGVSWPAARALLTSSQDGQGPRAPLEDRQGPAAPLAVRWIFETEGHVPIVSVQPLSQDCLLVADAAGRCYGVARTSGKLLWLVYRGRQLPARQPGVPRAPVLPVTGPAGTFLLAARNRCACYGSDGALRWESALGAPDKNSTPLSLTADASGVLAYDSHSGDVARFDAAGGRLVWHRTLAFDTPAPPHALGEGVLVADGKVLVFGPRTAVLDAASGQVLWTFEPQRARRVPFNLEEPDPDRHDGRRPAPPLPTPVAPTQPFATSLWGYPGSRLSPGLPYNPYLSRFTSPGSPPLVPVYTPGGVIYVSAFTGTPASPWSPAQGNAPVAVVAPAAHWASPLGALQSRSALLHRGRLLLLRDDAAQTEARRAGALQVLDLHLPMFGSKRAAFGTVLGLFGDHLCLLRTGVVAVSDVSTHATKRIDLTRIGGGRSSFTVHAALDGGVLYLAGPGGLTCVRIPSLREIFTVPWPSAARPAPEQDPPHLLFLTRGVVARKDPGQYGPLPPVGCVVADTLFLPSDAWRLVALETQAPKRGADGGGDGR